MPRVSIVIPTKNEEKLLPNLLKSIKGQTFSDYEIIVADAHSTDRTLEIAMSFGARVVEGGMPGPGRNRGALHATGDIIVFFDADVEMPSPKFLEECLAEMKEKDLDMATCLVKPITDRKTDKALHAAYNAYIKLWEKVLPHAPGFCLFVRRDAHHGVNGFDEKIVLSEDFDYVQRANKQGYKFGILRSHPIHASVRRLDKEGRLGIVMKYAVAETYMLTRGAIKKELFEYEMGGEEKK